MRSRMHFSKIAFFIGVFGVLNSMGQPYLFSDFEVVPMPHEVNTLFEESKPIVNSGGDSLFFVRSYYPENTGGSEAGQDIWFAKKENDQWVVPTNQLGHLNDHQSNIIIGYINNQKLYSLKYLIENETRYAIVCTSELDHGKWTHPVAIDLPPVKVGFGYHDFYVHPSEQVIMVSISRIDALGQEDIYIIYMDSRNEWIGPLNLGPAINSRGFEISPFLSADGQTIYFASDRTGGYGNADIWKSERTGSGWLEWGDAVNLGTVINSEAFDAYFFELNQDISYFVSNRYMERTDIFQVTKKSSAPFHSIALQTNAESQTIGNIDSPILSVYFDFDQFRLTPEAQQNIQTFCERFPFTNIEKIEVLGYTDPVGTSKYNKRLSKKRADEVADFMMDFGLDAVELHSRGEGIWPDKVTEEREMRQVKILVHLIGN